MKKTLTLKIEQISEDSYTCDADGFVMASGRTILAAIENALADYYVASVMEKEGHNTVISNGLAMEEHPGLK